MRVCEIAANRPPRSLSEAVPEAREHVFPRAGLENDECHSMHD